MENLPLLEFLINENMLDEKEAELAYDIRKAFRKQKSLSITFDYEKIFTVGGKQDTGWERVIESKRDWSNFEKILSYHISLFEKTLCVENTTEQLKREFKSKFWDMVGKVVFILERLARLRCSDWDLVIMELRKKVKGYGFRKTSAETKINQYSLKKLLSGSKKIDYSKLERLLTFFEIKNVVR